ncbi:MAG: methyltransferase domain-containing protein [Acidimicrobiia bacterium]|nr:methyltransferase domain-containing protein [Acidimicrobiia bacterium]
MARAAESGKHRAERMARAGKPMSAGATADLVGEVVEVGGRAFSLLRPRDVDAIVTDLVAADVRDDACLPFWAELWPAGVALAAAVAARSVTGSRALDLGCGLGLASVVAATGGAEVLAVDRSPEATARTAANAARNGVAVDTAVCSITAPGPMLARAPWDLVLVGDLLYERGNAEPLRRLLPHLVGGDTGGLRRRRDGARRGDGGQADGGRSGRRGEVWLADPGRPALASFLAGLDADGWRRAPMGAGDDHVSVWRLALG